MSAPGGRGVVGLGRDQLRFLRLLRTAPSTRFDVGQIAGRLSIHPRDVTRIGAVLEQRGLAVGFTSNSSSRRRVVAYMAIHKQHPGVDASWLIEHYGYIVETVLRQFRGRRRIVDGRVALGVGVGERRGVVDDDDFRQAGRVALWKAVDSWNPAGLSFTDWAYWQVEHAMFDEARKTWRRRRPCGGAAHYTFDPRASTYGPSSYAFETGNRHSFPPAADSGSPRAPGECPAGPPFLAVDTNLDSAMVVSLLAYRMLDAIETLPYPERIVFELTDVKGRGQREAARLLEVSTGTIVSLRRKARDIVREHLARDHRSSTETSEVSPH